MPVLLCDLEIPKLTQRFFFTQGNAVKKIKKVTIKYAVKVGLIEMGVVEIY